MESDLSQIYYFPTHSPQMPYYFLILQQLVLLLNLYGEANEHKVPNKILLPLRNAFRDSTRPPYHEHHFDVWRWR